MPAVQIDAGIALAKRFPETIVAISCGSEVRLRLFAGVANTVVSDCLRRLRAANVSQPLGYQGTWPEWCNEDFPGQHFPACLRWEPIVSLVDVVFVTAYSFWENRVGPQSGEIQRFPCVTPAGSANFHVHRLLTVTNTYPDKAVILSEFGWPGGPPAVDELASVKCGPVGGSASSEESKFLVARTTLCACQARGLSCILFSSHKEPWKGIGEGELARHWGMCESASPYACSVPAVGACGAL